MTELKETVLMDGHEWIRTCLKCGADWTEALAASGIPEE